MKVFVLNGVCSDGPGEHVLRLPQQHGAGAGEVPAHGRQEVAVLTRRGGGAQVLRAPRPPRPRPFKKACGSRCLRSRSHRAADRGGRRSRQQPRRRPRPLQRLLPHQRPPRPQRRACHMRACPPATVTRCPRMTRENGIRRDYYVVNSCNFFFLATFQTSLRSSMACVGVVALVLLFITCAVNRACGVRLAGALRGQ